MVNHGMQLKRRGLMIVLSSPSGAGKTSVSRAILNAEPDVHLSISWTTRTPRPNEDHGHHYHFVDHDQFHEEITAGGFLEYAFVFGQFYGTPRKPVEASLLQGQDVLFDIDWQGTQQLAQMARHDLVSIFLLPPTWGDLEKRLQERAQDSSETVTYRMSHARDEISHWAEYDYVLVNDDFEKTVANVKQIIHAERLRRERQIGLPQLIKELA